MTAWKGFVIIGGFLTRVCLKLVEESKSAKEIPDNISATSGSRPEASMYRSPSRS